MTWITPLGLPVMQPYRQARSYLVRTALQDVVLTKDSDCLPVSSQKQRSAFPPNFIHSLDATHMMMTSLKMKQRNLAFTAVHDSFWTHPADVEILHEVIVVKLCTVFTIVTLLGTAQLFCGTISAEHIRGVKAISGKTISRFRFSRYSRTRHAGHNKGERE